MSVCDKCGKDVTFATYHLGNHLCDNCFYEAKLKVIAS